MSLSQDFSFIISWAELKSMIIVFFPMLYAVKFDRLPRRMHCLSLHLSVYPVYPVQILKSIVDARRSLLK